MVGLAINVHYRDIFGSLFADPKRFNVVVSHRRSGKTVAAVQKMIVTALKGSKPDTRCIYIAPLRHQAKTVAWDLCKRMSEPIPGKSINESELRIDFPGGGRVQLFGSDNPDALRGMYADLAIMDEVDQMPPNTWTYVVRPLLADREGSAIFIGTPAGKQKLYELWEQAGRMDGWARQMHKASETGLLKAEELETLKQEMGEEAYNQEMECSWTAAIRGAFYGSLLERTEKAGHMVPIDRDPSVRLSTGWDLGTRDATAIWVIQPHHGNSWAVIDYYEASGYGVDHYASWLADHGYLEGARHIAPHDIANTDWSAAGGMNRKQVAAQYGIRFERVARAKNAYEVMEGINAVRMILPRMYFHSADDERGARVYAGRHALSLYRQAYNERLGALQANPVHDYTSHAADAMRAWASLPESRIRELPGEMWSPSVNINSKQERKHARSINAGRSKTGYSRRSGSGRAGV